MAIIKKTLIYRSISVLALATLVLIIFFYSTAVKYDFFIIPIVFFTLFLTLGKRVKSLIGRLPGLTTLIFIVFCRYCILPLVLYQTNELSIYARDYDYLNWAIVLMTFEMVCIFITINYRYRSFDYDTTFKIVRQSKVKARPSLLILSILLLVALIVTNRDLIGGFSLITKGYVEDTGVLTEKSSLPKILWTILSTFAYVYSIFLIASKRTKPGKKGPVFFCVLLTLLFIALTYISQERISRWYTLVCAISSIYFLRKMFPSQRKKLTLYIIVPVMILMISATILKNFAESKIYGNSQDRVLVTNLDAYLAGPVSVNNAIALNESKDVNLSNFFVDITNNMPVVNHFVDKDRATVYLYNLYLGRVFGSDSRGDQIIPLIGQGYIYFGPFLAPLLSILYIILISFFDKKYTQSTSYFCYLLAFTACWCSIAIILNMTLNLSWVYIRIIPIYVLFLLMKKIN